MSDWKPGDKAVFVHGHHGLESRSQPLRIGQVTTVVETLRDRGSCPLHGEVSGLVVSDAPEFKYCPGCFRRPINFTQLFNINTTVKETEDA